MISVISFSIPSLECQKIGIYFKYNASTYRRRDVTGQLYKDYSNYVPDIEVKDINTIFL